MRGRLLFIAGLIGGFVLGSRAGRGAYVSLKQRVQAVAANPQVQSTVDAAKRFAEQKAPDLASAAGGVAAGVQAAAAGVAEASEAAVADADADAEDGDGGHHATETTSAASSAPESAAPPQPGRPNATQPKTTEPKATQPKAPETKPEAPKPTPPPAVPAVSSADAPAEPATGDDDAVTA